MTLGLKTLGTIQGVNAIWPGHMPEPMESRSQCNAPRFLVLCMWVKVSQVSKYPREIKIMVPGQTPGLVIPSGPLVPTDRRDRRHRMYGYFSVQPAHVDLGSESYPAIQSRAKK